MELRPTNYDITWFLDQRRQGRINLEPPYQRKSVWGPKDRKFFLDTIFRGYPSPVIYLHKETKDDGDVTWHVVDGKQRLTSIFMFVDNKFALSSKFGDERLDGKRWKNLTEHGDLKTKFWDYTFSIQIVPQVESKWIQEVFDRLNRNSKNLLPQELRHAKFDGWFIKFIENEAEMNPVWKDLKVVTTGRARRMSDAQFISELAIATIFGKVHGFSQDQLDTLYAELDNPEELDQPIDTEGFEIKFRATLEYIREILRHKEELLETTKLSIHLYSLWSFLSIKNIDQTFKASEFAEKYAEFIQLYNELKEKIGDEDTPEIEVLDAADNEVPEAALVSNDKRSAVVKYVKNARGATTELPQRAARHEALIEYFL